MKVKNGEIFGANESFSKLVKQDFPVKDAIALHQLVIKLDEPLKLIENVRQGLVRKHGKDSGGNLEIITPNDPKRRPVSKSYPKFIEEYNELMNQEVEVDFKKVTLAIDGTSLTLSVNDLAVLEKFVEIK